jgi:uncharacterized membrane protein YdbT with pleckstrin-like domain
MGDSKNDVLKFGPELSGLKGEFVSSIFIILLGCFVCFFAPKPAELFKYTSKVNETYLGISLILWLFGVIKFLKLKIMIKTTKYTLTKQRLTLERGFLSKKISNLELWRVVDTELKQSASEVTTGGCTVVLTTQDLSDPVLYIRGLSIKNGKKIYNVINEHVANAVKNSGVTKMV